MVGLLAVPMVAHAAPFADTVVSFSAGGSGSGVYESVGGACAGVTGEGVFYPSAVTALDGCGVALGGLSTPPFGQIVMGFSGGSVTDGLGNDVRFFDTFGRSEGLTVEASADGVTFSSLGAAGTDFPVGCSLATPCATDFDLAVAGLTSASSFRITGTQTGATQEGCIDSYPECYDFDAAEALHFSTSSVPEPATLALIAVGLAGLAAVRRRMS